MLIVAGLLALLAWVLPVFDVNTLGSVDLGELGSVGVAAAGVAALLARANTPATESPEAATGLPAE